MTSVQELAIQLTEKYYETHRKNIFFKNTQKFDCARDVCSKIDIVSLMDQTFWLVPNHDQFYFDYRVYKLYGNPDNFPTVIENFLNLLKWCIKEYGSFELHLNFSSFTVSAAERYRIIVQMICDLCMNQTEVPYMQHLKTLTIHNTPKVFDHIYKILIPILPPEIIPKLRILHKDESTPILTEMYAHSGKIYTAETK
jgi:hypothetical protein